MVLALVMLVARHGSPVRRLAPEGPIDFYWFIKDQGHLESNPPGTATDSMFLFPGWWPTLYAMMRGSTTQTSLSFGDIQGQNASWIQFGWLLQATVNQSFRSITEDIAQAETKLRDLRKERAQEVTL